MSGTYFYPATAIRVCVDEIDGRAVKGRAYCAQLDDIIEFSDLGSLLVSLEDVFDRRGYPDAFQKKRSFVKSGVSVVDFKEKRALVHQMQQRRELSHENGKAATFLLYVVSRRNSSWQGRAEWLDDGTVSIFSSALGFLRIADARLVRGEYELREDASSL